MLAIQEVEAVLAQGNMTSENAAHMALADKIKIFASHTDL
jgi:hypothetical protein